MQNTRRRQPLSRTGRRAPLARPYPCFPRGAGGSRTHLKLLCRQPPCRLAPAPSYPVSSPGVEPGLRPSRGRVLVPSHSEDSFFKTVPRRGIEPRPTVSRTAVQSGTPAGHFQSVSRPGIEPGPGPSEGPMRSVTPSGQTNQSRRLDSHQHNAVYRTAAFLHRATSASKQEREDLNPVRRLWRPSALPGAHSCNGSRPFRPGAWRNDYPSNWTFQ